MSFSESLRTFLGRSAEQAPHQEQQPLTADQFGEQYRQFREHYLNDPNQFKPNQLPSPEVESYEISYTLSEEPESTDTPYAGSYKVIRRKDETADVILPSQFIGAERGINELIIELNQAGELQGMRYLEPAGSLSIKIDGSKDPGCCLSPDDLEAAKPYLDYLARRPIKTQEVQALELQTAGTAIGYISGSRFTQHNPEGRYALRFQDRSSTSGPVTFEQRVARGDRPTDQFEPAQFIGEVSAPKPQRELDPRVAKRFEALNAKLDERMADLNERRQALEVRIAQCRRELELRVRSLEARSGRS